MHERERVYISSENSECCEIIRVINLEKMAAVKQVPVVLLGCGLVGKQSLQVNPERVL